MQLRFKQLSVLFIAALFLVFAVSLSMAAMGDIANKNAALAKAMASAAEYADADARAQDKLMQIEQALINGDSPQSIDGVSYIDDDTICFDIAIDDLQTLHVSIALNAPGEAKRYEINAYCVK